MPDRRQDSAKAFMQKTVLFLLACFLVLACFTLWRLANVLYRFEKEYLGTERFAEALVKDLPPAQQPRPSASSQPKRPAVKRVPRKTSKAILSGAPTPIQAQINSGGRWAEELDTSALIGRKAKPLTQEKDPETDREVGKLLKSVLKSDLIIREGPEIRSTTYLYARMYTKYKMYRHLFRSAEDFINVATVDILGETYNVVGKDKKLKSLKVWLLERLEELRTKNKSAD